jgi:hypothetical protein
MDSDLYARLAATGRVECPECGYSLAGLPGPHRCTECGRAYGRNILTWRPAYPGAWLAFVVAGPSLAYTAYLGWQTRFRIFFVAFVVGVLALWSCWLRWIMRVARKQYVCLDDRGVSFNSGMGARQIFEWRAVEVVCKGRARNSILIRLRNGREHRVPSGIPSRQVNAFIEAANAYATTASESALTASSPDEPITPVQS